MKKILILFTLLIVFIPNVKAVEISCSTSENLLKPNNFIDGLYRPFDYSPYDVGFLSSSYNALIPVEPSTKYSFLYYSSYLSTKRIAVAYYDKNFEYLTYFNTLIGSYPDYRYTFTTNKDAYYITLHLYTISASTLNSNFYQLTKGSFTLDKFDYVQCPPGNPGSVVPDTTLNDFYSIYIDKLTLLSDYVVENKFLFSWIGIILLFVILEIILKLLNLKGGKY